MNHTYVPFQQIVLNWASTGLGEDGKIPLCSIRANSLELVWNWTKTELKRRWKIPWGWFPSLLVTQIAILGYLFWLVFITS